MDETSEMSEVERRREMRRRRILANQGNRMNKLMGIASTDEKSVSMNNSSNSLPAPSSSLPPTTAAAAAGGDEQHIAGGAQLLDSLVTSTLHSSTTSMSSSSSSSTANATHNSNVTSTPVPDIFSLLQSANSTAAQDNMDTTSTEAPAHHSFYTFRHLLCFVMGVIVRLSLLTNFGAEYVQTMVYPFITMEIAIIGYQQATFMELWSGGGGGGGGSMMWLTALQLAGVRREIIHTYKQAMGAVTNATDDFTSYFFAFIVTHLFLWT